MKHTQIQEEYDRETDYERRWPKGMKLNQIRRNRITTDDPDFSAYLKLKGHRLIKSDSRKSKAYLTFQAVGHIEQLKEEFINEFAQFYNELRNLKKIVPKE